MRSGLFRVSVLVALGALIGLVATFVTQPASAQTEAVIAPEDVAFLQADGCGQSPNIVVRRDEDPAVQNLCDDAEQRTVLEFDLGSLAGLTVESASLELNKTDGALPSIELFAFAGDQVVTSADWDATEQALGEVDISSPPTTVDVTGAVQNQAGGSLGFLLVDAEGADGGGFFDPAGFLLRVTVADIDPMLYLSSTSGGNAGGVSFADEDILRFDQGESTWTMVFDGSDVGVGSGDVDAFRIVADPALGDEELIIELSFDAPRTISGIGSVDDSDIVIFTGVGGTNTAGTFSRLTDFSDVGISSAGEDVDAWTADGTDYLLSTLGGIAAQGTSGADEDLLRFTPTALGDPTAGSLELLFDGSDVMPSSRDLVAASFDENTEQLYGAFLSGLSASGVTADGDDVVVFTGNLGSATSGTFELVFDGDTNGWVNEQIDGLHVVPGSAAPTDEADLSVTIDDDVTDAAPAGSTITFSVDVANASTADAEDVTVVLMLPESLTFVGTTGCDNDGSTPPCELGTVPASSTATFTFQGQLTAVPGATVNTGVSVAAANPDPDAGDNSASVETTVAIAPSAVNDGPASNSVPGDPFHIAEGESLSVNGAGGVLANDDLGDPAALAITFGGGDLGGDVNGYAAGEVAPIAGTGSLQVDTDGSLDFTPADGFVGTFLFDYAIGNAGGTSVATVEILVGDRPQLAEGDLIFVSSTSGGNVNGVAFADEDILRYDTATDTWSMFFDASDVQLGASDIDGFDVVSAEPGNTIIDFTVTAPRNHDQIGPFDDSDVVRFEGSSGPQTSGTLTLRIDGSDVGLTLIGEDLDALAMDPTGDYAFSTLGNHNVPGVSGGRDEDVTLFEPSSLGQTTAGSFSVLLDGSDIGLGAKDVRAVEIHPVTGEIYTMTPNTLRVDGLTSDQDDIIVHSGDTGPNTTGTWSLFWDGDLFGFGGEQIDGMSIEFSNAAPVANPDRAATDENTPITIGPDYTTSISSDGGEISKIAADPRTGNYVVLDVVSSLVRVRVYDPVNRRVLHTTSIPTPGPAAAVPGGVDVDLRTGNIVVVESRSSTVTVFDPTLSTVLDSETVTGLGSVRAVTVDPFTGNIIVGGQDLSRIYTSGFASSTDVDHNGLVATGFDVDERNDEIVAVLYEDQGSLAPGQIQRWESDGSLIQTITTSEMDFPADLSIEQPTGDIAVPNFSANNSLVVTFDEDGNTESVIGGFSGPSGVAYDPMTGNLTVADDGGSLVNPTTGALLDSFLDRRGHTMAVQPVSEEILANSGPGRHPRLVTLDPTTRTRLGLDERFVVDVATDPTTGRIAVIIGEAIASRVLEIYDPTGSNLLHSTSVPGASVAFHPDTGEVAVSLRTGEFRLYDPTLTTVLTSFPFARTDMLGVQPGTGNIVTRFGSSEVRIFDDGGSQVGSIGPFNFVSDFAVDPATGNIAVAVLLANAETEVWDPTGTTMLDSIPVPSAGDSAVGVAYGGTGNLIIGYDNHGSLDVMARGVLANDTDPDGDPLTVTGFDATSAKGAAVTVNPDGSFTYDPTGVPAIEALDAGQTLTDTFTYTIDDGNGETDTATAMVFVAGVNDAPVLGGPAAITVAENTTAVADFNATDDTNSEGSGLTYSFIGEVDGERLSINTSTGALQFNPPADFENPDDANQDNVYEIVVGVTDSDGLSDALNVTVTVTDVADTGSITIIQDTVPDWATDFSFTGGLGAFSLDDDAAAPSNSGDNTLSNTFEATLLEPGVYTVTQSAVSPFVVTSLDCTGGSTSTDTGTRTATITLAAGDAVTCTFTTEPSSDVSVTLSDSPDPIVAGQTLDYLFGFSTTFPVSNPVLTLDLPAGVTYVGALNGFDSFCSESAPGFVTCDGFNGLWNGATFRIQVMVDAGTVGSISATGSVSFTGVFDPNLANNTATVTTTVTAPDLPPTLVSSTPSEGGTIEPDDDLVLTFSEPVTLVESAGPAMFLVCDTGGSITLSVTGGPTVFTVSPSPNLPPGANCTLTLEASRVLDQDGTPDQLAGDDNFDFQVAPRVDLSISKTDSADPVTAGGSLTYTIEVANAGPQEATNVVVTDTLPAGVTFVSTSGCAEDPSGVPTCTLGSISSGLSKSYTVTVTVDSGTTGTVTNSVSVTADETDSNVANNTASEETTVGAPATPGSAADDAYDSLGNVGISVPIIGGLLDNDTNGSVGNNVVGAVEGSAANVGVGITTTNGGSLFVAANGSFLYNPPAGFEGTDTFTYTIDDGIAGANPNETATATITVAQMIWFIDNDAAIQGDGTMLKPFNTIGGTGFASASDDPGDIIYLDGGAGAAPYVGTFNLKDDQLLVGEGSSQSLDTVGGFTIPTFSLILPTTTPSALVFPKLQTTSGNAINLGTDNTVRGMTVGNTAGHAMSGTGFGTLTTGQLIINGSGGAFALVNGVLDVNVSCITASTSSSTTPTLQLRTVSGSFQMDCGVNGTLDAVSGQAVDIVGTGTLDINTLRFTSVSASNAVTGINLENIASGSFAVNGTVTTDGSGGTIQTVSGNGIQVNNVNSATFKNMNLTNANTSDGVSAVVGSTCDSLSSGTNTGCNGAVKLTNTGPVTLDNLNINGTEQNGITGTTVDALTVTNTVLSNIGNITGTQRENGIHIVNLTGSSNISGNTFNGDLTHTTRNVLIENNTGTLNLAFNDNTIQNADITGLLLQALGTATVNLSSVRNTFDGNGGTEFQANVNDTATFDLNLGDGTAANENVFAESATSLGAGVVIDARGSATVTFDILGNEIRELSGSGIIVAMFDNADGEGRINGNEVQGTDFGWGIRAFAESVGADSPELTVQIDNNTIGNVDGISSSGAGGAGIEVTSQQGSVGSGTATVHGTVTNNTITIGGADSIIQHFVDASNLLCLNVQNNSGAGAATSPFAGAGSTHYIGNPAAGNPNGPGTVSYVGYLVGDLGSSWNANGNTPVVAAGTTGQAFVDGTEPTAVASCTLPTNS